MAVLPLRYFPDQVLRQKAKRVSKIDDRLQRLFNDMIETMHAAEGVGLAAPQIGISLRIAVIGLPEEEPIVLVNPELIKKEGERSVLEGCLSLPGYRAELTRAEKVKVKALDRTGKELRLKADGLLAQALEHEIDHLNGKLYIDLLDSPDKLQKVEQEETIPEVAASAKPAAVVSS
ncbi:MAG: peptide deformylase [Chloroflexi bacterium]|nr:peptide deformylase [Chloroflexota bacterium]